MLLKSNVIFLRMLDKKYQVGFTFYHINCLKCILLCGYISISLFSRLMILTFFVQETSICHWFIGMKRLTITAVTVIQHDDDTKRQTILRLITYLSLILILSLSAHLHSSSTFVAKYAGISLFNI